MSTLQNNQALWSTIPNKTLDSKQEKCRNIAEEIYKRINITFQIKKLEAGTHSEFSDHSDHIDSNELSNETDLFACDKSSISSSTELDALVRGSEACEKFINNNNNEETKAKNSIIYKRPKKRFRKRVKKQQKNSSKQDSDGSSDEEPLSHVADLDSLARSERPLPSPSHTVMGVPYVVIRPCDLKLKLKIPTPEKKVSKKDSRKTSDKPESQKSKPVVPDLPVTDKCLEIRNCTKCSLTFRGERGLRRHMAISHTLDAEHKK